MKYIDIKEVESNAGSVTGIQTAISDLDWIYGRNPYQTNHAGIPNKSISIWAGEAGVGKSRLSAQIVFNIATFKHKVLYFQLEMSMESFTSLYFNSDNYFFSPDCVFLSDEADILEQCKIIEEIKPDIIIVDSINCVDVPADAKGSKFIEKTYRKSLEKTNAALICLCQLNQDGTTKGGTTLPHMGDVLVKLTSGTEKDTIVATMGKNRFGVTKRQCFMKHTDSGVDPNSSFAKQEARGIVQSTDTDSQKSIKCESIHSKVDSKSDLKSSPDEKEADIKIYEEDPDLCEEKFSTLDKFLGRDGKGNFVQRLFS